MTIVEIQSTNYNELFENSKISTVLTIAGSDSSGGAGIEADLKTIQAHGCYGLTCITGLTAQNTTGVISIHVTPKHTIKDILRQNFSDISIDVVKTGMMTSEAIDGISEFIEENPTYFGKVMMVLDPVMIASTGASLCDETSIKLCIDKLFPKAFLITPNFVEAEAILRIVGEEPKKIESIEDLKEMAKLLQSKVKCTNVLIKGGHIPFDSNGNPTDDDSATTIYDILYQSSTDNHFIFKSQYIRSENTHGTGCTLASSISSNLSKGGELINSIEASISYIHKAMSTGLKIGHGKGPLNHTVGLPTVSLTHFKNEHPTYNKDFFNYMKTHPTIVPNWLRYTNHGFITEISLNRLPYNQFIHFIKQDYVYLINYARIQALAASAAPDIATIQSESQIINNVAEELERHKLKLAKYGIDLNTIQPAQACVNYCNYLIETGKKEDYLGIKVALAPCLHGYAEAAEYGMKTPNLVKEGVYYEWLCDYTSEEYSTAYRNGVEKLERLTEGITQDRVEQLVEIFNKVTILEAEFWDEVLSFDQ